MVSVEDCNDGDQGNGVSKGMLRVLGAFRTASECVEEAVIAMVALVTLSASSLNLISIAVGSKEGPKRQQMG
jgi:hypothetical protein